MHAVIRRYTGATPLIAELDRRRTDVEGIMTTVPGFVSYHAIRSGDALMTVSVCQDQAGTTEMTKRAAEWVRANITADSLGAPEISEGEMFISIGAPT